VAAPGIRAHRYDDPSDPSIERYVARSRLTEFAILTRWWSASRDKTRSQCERKCCSARVSLSPDAGLTSALVSNAP
jgi:hypothetical protein